MTNTSPHVRGGSAPTASTPPVVGVDSSPPVVGADALPWPSLLVLATATLVMVTGEMLPTAVLGQMSAGLGVTEASVGLLVSLWAAVVVVASFPLVRLTRKLDRRAVIVASMVAFATSSALTALAPTYQVAIGGRLIGAAAVGLLWSTVNAHVADLVPDRLLGRAVAVVLGGATFGLVLGTPVARFVAEAVGWRSAFWGLAVIALGIAALVRAIVAAPPGLASDSPADGDPSAGIDVIKVATRSARPMIVVAALTGLTLMGHYGAYTFITRLTEAPAGFLAGGMSTVLLLFGVASAAGVVLAGRFGDRTAPALVVGTAATALSILALAVTGANAALGLVVVVAWGVTSGTLGPLAQTLILRLGGPERRSTAGALIPVVFNGGIAVGAALASGVVAASSPAQVPVPAALIVITATIGLALATRRLTTA